MSIFTQVQQKKIGSNVFDLSHDRKMSMQMGNLTPIYCMEVIPGDNIKMSTSQMLRMAPMISPVMHKITVYTHFFFVPNRIVWDGWEEFITGGEHGDAERLFPKLTIDADEGSGITPGSVADYMGLPVSDASDAKYRVSALPFAAYYKIYNEYYRDQNLIDPYVDTCNDSFDTNTALEDIILKEPLRRAWSHDYFTSALPWTQKGAEATIPLGTTAPIDFTFMAPDAVRTVTGHGTVGNRLGVGSFPLAGALEGDGVSAQPEPSSIDNTANLSVDLSQATASTINDLRRAFKLQEWLEKNARGGSRYIESILSHFGVKSSDARLQRPEYLGGGNSPMTISEVLQTSSNDTEPTPQGNMAGHGISVGASGGFSYSAEEHGYIIGIMSIMPKAAYFQGVPKHFQKFDKFDHYWPSFAHLGEQPIYNRELYLDQNEGENDDVFGYTPRYAEYKHHASSVHGEFKTTLDFWHMARKFENRPQLNQQFINCVPTTRIFAVEDEEVEKIYCHIFHRIKARRKMPFFGTPSF